MPVDAKHLTSLIESELQQVTDSRVLSQIRCALVEPKPHMRDWDYGEPGQQYLCWTVFDHQETGAAIDYCEEGFGPKHPWGLVWLDPSLGSLSMGMDSVWYASFLDAYFESFAPTVLSIWRVFKTGPGGMPHAIGDEDTWKATWQRVYALRASDPQSRYDCNQSIYKLFQSV